MTSCRFHRTLPPSLIGFGSLPAEFNRHTCLSETPSIAAKSRAETAMGFARLSMFVTCSSMFFRPFKNGTN